MSAGYSFQIHHPQRNVACVLGFSWPTCPQITSTPTSALMRIRFKRRSRLTPNQNTAFVFFFFFLNRRIKAQSGLCGTNESNLFGYCCVFHQESKRWWLKRLGFLLLRRSRRSRGTRRVYNRRVLVLSELGYLTSWEREQARGSSLNTRRSRACLDLHANGRFKCL